MSLMSGTRLGPYEILAELGRGGMGEVYRAKDTRLGRDVAIKTLPAGLTTDADQRARFEREARAASSLNHPHICVIHDVGSDNGVDYLVMELLEGETAADCVGRGPMPVAEVMRLGSEIADALDRAHKKGLVHRDLKPANLMLVRPGSKSGLVHAKLLDFGLARPTATTAGGETMTKALTAAGAIVGTFQYMSPEQVEGREVDGRTDIWSLGATLYEMAAGVRAFDGASAASLISAVLRDEPAPLAERVPLTPPAFQRVVSQCLAKDPDDRWQSAGDVKRELDWISRCSASSVSASAAPSRGHANPWIPRIAIAASMIVVAAAAWWIGHGTRTAAPAWSQFTQLTDASGIESGPTISPDGSSFAYASNTKGSWDVYVQRVGGRNPIVVAGDPNKDEMWPAFSPDGTQIAFNESGGQGGIFVVGATGESARRLTDFGANPAWSPDGLRIVFSTHEVISVYDRAGLSTLWIVDLAGGAPVQLDDADAIQPSWSPSGARIAFWMNRGGQRDLATMPAGGGPVVQTTSDPAADWAPVWSPDGRFLYFASDRGGSMGIWRIGIDELSGTPTSTPEVIAAGVDVSMDLPHLSADGTALVFRSIRASINPAAIPFDPATERAGQVTLLQNRTGILVPSDVSSDGKWVTLFNLGERQEDIFIMRPDGSELSRVTDDAARDRAPRFTPDGSALTFYSNKSGSFQGWSMRLDGGDRRPLTSISERSSNFTVISPDGLRILVVFSNNDWLIGPAPGPLTLQSGTVTATPRVGAGFFAPRTWSPDGRWLTGRIRTPAGGTAGNAMYDLQSGTVRLLSEDAGGADVAWMPDNRRVVYFTTRGSLVIQDITTLTRREINMTSASRPELGFSIVASPDGRTIYYGAPQTEANIWKVEQPGAVNK
jgi:serine/threonine protein kinase